MKKNIIKILVVLLIIAAVSVGLYFLFDALGITDVDTLQKFISSCGAWGIVVFIIVETLLTIFLCFVPAGSMTIVTVGVALYGANWKTFLICFSGVILSSIIMDLIGRFGGTKLIIKLIGKKDYDSALTLVKEKGMVYVPVMYLLPVFPDDAICMICGATKIKFWLHLIYIVTCRGIGCATIVFGISFIPSDLLMAIKQFDWQFIGNNIIRYLQLVVICLEGLGTLLYIARRIDKWLSKKMKVSDNKNLDKLVEEEKL